MLSSDILVLILSYCIYHNNSLRVIWSDAMDPPLNTSKWSFNGSPSVTSITTDSYCVEGDDNANCWKLCATNSNTESGYIYKIAPTTGYTNISVQYNIDPWTMVSNGETCSIWYNLDNQDDNWLKIGEWTSDHHIIEQIVYLDSSTWNNAGVGIKILAVGSTENCCYISDFSLRGVPIQVSNGPTQSPITNPTKNPTKSPSSQPSEHGIIIRVTDHITTQPTIDERPGEISDLKTTVAIRSSSDKDENILVPNGFMGNLNIIDYIIGAVFLICCFFCSIEFFIIVIKQKSKQREITNSAMAKGIIITNSNSNNVSQLSPTDDGNNTNISSENANNDNIDNVFDDNDILNYIETLQGPITPIVSMDNNEREFGEIYPQNNAAAQSFVSDENIIVITKQTLGNLALDEFIIE